MTMGPTIATPDLPQVTLVAVTGVALSATVRALRLSMQQARFGHVLMLSDRRPADAKDIEWRPIASLTSRAAYSRFMLAELGDHIGTDFALVVQWDGYVRDGRAWRPAFLDYDYIGAPWPQHDDGATVGNGGFSLRSRRLLAATRGIDPGDAAEDVAICRVHRAALIAEHGIRFAPPALATAFSHERGDCPPRTFGFHGVFNMIEAMPPDEAATVLATLEPGLLARRERREVLEIALRRRHVALLAAAVRHRLARLL